MTNTLSTGVPAEAVEALAGLRLQVPRAQAAGELAAAAKIGQAIRAQRIRDPQELEIARSERTEWVARTSDLLTKLFASSTLIDEFSGVAPRILPEFAPFVLFCEAFREEMRLRLIKIQRLMTRLERIPERVRVVDPAAMRQPAIADLSKMTSPSGRLDTGAQEPPRRFDQASTRFESMPEAGRMAPPSRPAPEPYKSGARILDMVILGEDAEATDNPPTRLVGPSGASSALTSSAPTVVAPATSPSRVTGPSSNPSPRPVQPFAPSAASTASAGSSGWSDSGRSVTCGPSGASVASTHAPSSVASVRAKAAVTPVPPAVRPVVIIAVDDCPIAARVLPVLQKLGLAVTADPAVAKASSASFLLLMCQGVDCDLYELGRWVGRMGDGKVAVLFDDGLGPYTQEVPQIGCDETERWQLPLARLLKKSGLPVDMNRLV